MILVLTGVAVGGNAGVGVGFCDWADASMVVPHTNATARKALFILSPFCSRGGTRN
jgi:hypothetical protein